MEKRVLICVESLAYNRGGIASIGRLISREFSKQGWSVTVVTHNIDGRFTFDNVRIVLNPSIVRLLREFLRTDYVVSVGDLLRMIWPLFFVKRKSIVVKHGSVNAKSRLHRALEQILAKRVVWGGVSKYVVDQDNVKGSVVVPNARDPEIFYQDKNVVKKYDLLFVGGITEEKGIFTLADAISMLKRKNIQFNRLTMVGEGKDSCRFKQYIEQRLPGGSDLVMTGNLDANSVADMMRCHRIVIAPSMNIVWREAFSLVPIEAMSCGCHVIVSDSGGLPESGGPCAQVFPCGNHAALANCISRALAGEDYWSDKLVQKHLARYTPQNLVKVYLELINERFQR